MKNYIYLLVFMSLSSCFVKESNDVRSFEVSNSEETRGKTSIDEQERIRQEEEARIALENAKASFIETKSELEIAYQQGRSSEIQLKEREYEESLKKIKSLDEEFIDQNPPSISEERKMQIAYDNAMERNSAFALKSLLDEYPNHPKKKSIEDRIIELEVDDIFRDNTTGQLPAADRLRGNSTQTSSVSITNDTGCELTLRYVGVTNKKIIIPIGRTQKVSLSSGNYRVTASACGANYAGSEILDGEYSSTFYITRNRY